MCFRPAEVSMKTCPACGKVNKPVATECEACGAELEKTEAQFDANQDALDALGANAKPAAPGMPSVPAPGAPKPPMAPPSPKAGE